MKTFEYRLYPNKEQHHLLMQCLMESRLLYNQMLEMVKTPYEQDGTFLTKYDLEKAFKGQGTHVPATTVQMLADRLSKSLNRFLAAKQNTILTSGFPRFKTPNRWHSIQLRQYGPSRDIWLDKKHLHVPARIGKVLKIKVHRPLEGTPKTAHLVLRADGHWHALIVCEMERVEQEHPSSVCPHEPIGIDVDLKSFLTDSDGNTVDNPRFYRTSQRTLRRKQRTIARRQKGSRRRRKACKSAAQTHLKIQRQRRDFHFKVAKQYSEAHSIIAVEDLNICSMVKNHCLAKSISDAGWGQFLALLEVKAGNAGHQVRRVSPRYTSQKCSQCGQIVQKSLSVRTHLCPFCGYIADRDTNGCSEYLKERSRARASPSRGNVQGYLMRFLRSPCIHAWGVVTKLSNRQCSCAVRDSGITAQVDSR